MTVRVGGIDGDGFCVTGEGPGLPSNVRETLSVPGVTSTSGGTGFGLAIFEETVDAHGWDIGATERAACGERFEIRGADADEAAARG